MIGKIIIGVIALLELIFIIVYAVYTKKAFEAADKSCIDFDIPDLLDEYKPVCHEETANWIKAMWVVVLLV